MPPNTPKTTQLQAAFNQLAAQWEKETAFHSNSYFITNHPAYRQIIEMGDAALPLIFRAMKTRPYLWHYALHDITGASPPIAEADHGIPGKIDAAWLKWGRENGYIW